MDVKWLTFRTPYNESKVKRYVPITPGIYLLWVKLKGGKKWRCFYVGKAKNLEKRLLEHLSDTEENKCIKNNTSNYICGFECTKVANQSDRDGIEKYLYNHYKPKCNKEDPGGEPIKVNLP